MTTIEMGRQQMRDLCKMPVLDALNGADDANPKVVIVSSDDEDFKAPKEKRRCHPRQPTA